jgi:hypothetical protein
MKLTIQLESGVNMDRFTAHIKEVKNSARNGHHNGTDEKELR